jgi:DNA repair photolyase
MRSEIREEPCRSALNHVKGMPFEWSLNPYMGCAHRCAFCYVRAFERRADRPSDERYGASVRAKINIAAVLRLELERPSWKRDVVVVGAATDPYQPAEGRYRLTRQCLEVLAAARNPFGIITRGPLVVRDIEVLAQASSRADVHVTFSIPTLDEDVWKRTEEGAAPPRARLAALRSLIDAGINAQVGMAPILPGLSDRPEQLEAVVRAARDAGATKIWTGLLHLNPGTREHFLETLSRHWPSELERYRRLYARGAYLARPEEEPVRTAVAQLKDRFAIRDRRKNPIHPEEEPVQLELAV